MLELKAIEQEQEAEDDSESGADGLAGQHDEAAGGAVGDDAADEGEGDHGDGAGEGDEAQGGVGAGELVGDVGADDHLGVQGGHGADEGEEEPAEGGEAEGVEGAERSEAAQGEDARARGSGRGFQGEGRRVGGRGDEDVGLDGATCLGHDALAHRPVGAWRWVQYDGPADNFEGAKGQTGEFSFRGTRVRGGLGEERGEVFGDSAEGVAAGDEGRLAPREKRQRERRSGRQQPGDRAQVVGAENGPPRHALILPRGRLRPLAAPVPRRRGGPQAPEEGRHYEHIVRWDARPAECQFGGGCARAPDSIVAGGANSISRGPKESRRPARFF